MKKIYLAALLTLAFGVAGTASSAPYQNNPYSLVYDHAITQNVKNEVNIHPVNYMLHGVKIAAYRSQGHPRLYRLPSMR